MTRILPALLLLLALPAHAEIYKWVDDRGRTHFGEAPPEKYRKSAAPVATPPVNTIEGKVLGKGRDREAGESGSASAATPPPEPRLSEAEQCARAHERFSASQACFARYRNANGSLKADAADKCEAIAQPTCDLQR